MPSRTPPRRTPASTRGWSDSAAKSESANAHTNRNRNITSLVCFDVPFLRRCVRSYLAFRIAAIALTLGNYFFRFRPAVGGKRLSDIDLFFGELPVGIAPDVPFVVFVWLH